MISVLLVDDSRTVLEQLAAIVQADPRLELAGTATDGPGAIDAVRRLRPSVVTMDINMPRMNGLQATRQIMETTPVPIVIVSTNYDEDSVKTAFDALEAGALTAVPKPVGPGHPDYEHSSREFVQTLVLMSEIHVIRRRTRRPVDTTPVPSDTRTDVFFRPSARPAVIAIGASTGGPPALVELVSGLPRDLPVPVLIVQHMSPGFIEGFAAWLERASGFPVHLAENGDRPLAGHVYVAPDDRHLGLAADGDLQLSASPPRGSHRPAVSYLFDSVNRVHPGRAIGVLLTGMGRDGAAELLALRQSGSLTMAQDQASSVVHGMPGEAIRLGAARCILPPAGIAAEIHRRFSALE